MEILNIHEAKTHLSRLIQRVLLGEKIVIAKSGRPLISLVPYESSEKKKRKGGGWKGLIDIKGDFNDPLPTDLEEAFYT